MHAASGTAAARASGNAAATQELESSDKRRWDRRSLAMRTLAPVGKGAVQGEAAKENVAASPMSRSWWSSGGRSTSKSRLASGKAVHDRVEWEMEKASLLRDLTPKETALVLTFSDHGNFRAAVGALKKMRDRGVDL
jgi:hypothetical protein